MSGPLAGVRVVDLTTILLGPVATQMLGDMGADVVKVEAPGGDAMRRVGPPPADDMGAVFLASNRNKRSIVLDLKRPEGLEALLRIVEGADVFVHNMRPQSADRLGIGYAPIAARRADIVYCAAYGFRREGPYGAKPAYDDMIQAASGLAALQGRGDAPAYVTSAIADKITGLHVVQAIAMALFHRERTGEGQAVEVPMFECLVGFNMPEHLYGHAYEPARGPMGYPRTLSPDRRPFATLDGWIGVLPYDDRQWRALFEVAGRPDLAADPRFADIASRLANIDEVYATLSTLMATRTTAEWIAVLDAASVPAMPVNHPNDLVDDPHLAETGFWSTIDDERLGTLRVAGIGPAFSKSPGAVRRIAPRLGEHGVEVLTEAGLTPAEIEALIASGVTIRTLE